MVIIVCRYEKNKPNGDSCERCHARIRTMQCSENLQTKAQYIKSKWHTSKEIGSCGAHARLNVRVTHTGHIAVLHHLTCERNSVECCDKI